jgi:hypothetical protein
VSRKLKLALFLVGTALTVLSLAAGCAAMESAPAPAASEAPASAPTEAVVAIPTMPLISVPTAIPTAAPTVAPTAIPVLPEYRRLTLEWPDRIKIGTSDRVRLTLEMDTSGKLTPTAEVAGHQVTGDVIEIPNLYETHNITAQARLDMAGMPIEPASTTNEALMPGQPVTFYWSLRPVEAGTYQGTVWLHLLFVPKAGGEEVRKAISAQLIEVKAVTFLGLTAGPAGVLGAAGSVLGSVLGFPFLEDIVKWVWRKQTK